jgi:hypothetical protein
MPSHHITILGSALLHHRPIVVVPYEGSQARLLIAKTPLESRGAFVSRGDRI